MHYTKVLLALSNLRIVTCSLTLCVKPVDIYMTRTFPSEALAVGCYNVLKTAAEGLCRHSHLLLVQHLSALCAKQVSAGINSLFCPNLGQVHAKMFNFSGHLELSELLEHKELLVLKMSYVYRKT